VIIRRTRAAQALVAAVLVVSALLAQTAGAANGQRAKISEAPVSHFPDMAYVLSLKEKQALSASQVSATENGSPVRDVSVSKPGAEGFGVVLLIDASKSMEGRPIAGAMAAARAFAARRTPGQQLGLMTFNDQTTVVLPLTSDGAAISQALAKVPALAAGTHIHDALATASRLLSDSGLPAGSIVLLSDGNDVGSSTNQESAIDSVKSAKIRVFAVGLRSGQFDPAALKAIAAATSGSYTEASSAAALTGVFTQLGFTLSNEYLLRYRSLLGPDKKVRVAVKIKGVPGTARANYTSSTLPTAAIAEGKSLWDKIIQSWITVFVVILIVVLLIGYGVFRIVYTQGGEVTRRIGQFVTLPEDEKAKERQAEVAAMLATDVRRPRGSNWDRVNELEEDLAIARIDLSLRSIVLITVLAGLALGVLISILVGSPIGLLAGLVAPFVTKSVIARRLARVRRTFSDQLPDNLDVLASGLRSGHSFTGALAVVVDDAAEPSKGEFQRVIADEQLGVPIDESLHVTARRMESRDAVQIALVARLQREAGTNAADVLDQVSDNVRARLELRRLIATLTAQGRMARWIVSLLPVGLFAAIYLLNPDYLEPLWTEAIGVVALICAGVMMITGSLIIKRIIEIEV
jgi:tight adherence protein B